MGKDGKKGLGMGLGALFGVEYPSPQPEREETAPDLLPIVPPVKTTAIFI